MTSTSPGGLPTVDSHHFRHVVGHLPSGVTVVTTASDGHYGMTASSVTSLSADPALMLVCLNNSVPTAAAVSRAGRYAVNVLGEGSGELAYRFATPRTDKFAGVDTTIGPAGTPLLSEALAHIECEVTERVVGGTHTIFIGRVVFAAAGDGQPLTYFQGGFGRFEFAADDDAYRRLRRQVVERRHPPGEALTVEGLASSLEIENRAAFYALTRLATEGLVRRDEERGYLITPFDTTTSDETFDARRAIELGVIDDVIDTATDEQIIELRQRFDVMARLLVGDRFVDFDAYLDANFRFHRDLVSLAGNGALSTVFESLSIKQVMSRSFGATEATSQDFVDLQGRLMSAIEHRDRREAVQAIRLYTERAKERAREILSAHGGSL